MLSHVHYTQNINAQQMYEMSKWYKLLRYNVTSGHSLPTLRNI